MKLIYWSVPLGLFIWSIFQPTMAVYVFIGIIILFEGYLFFVDIFCKPNPSPLLWAPDEIKIIKKYHISFRYPFGAKDISVILNGFRWSTLLWVPWLLWNHIWVPASFIAINFFITSSLSVRLDPFYFLADAINRGQYQFSSELSLLQEVAAKLRNQNSF